MKRIVQKIIIVLLSLIAVCLFLSSCSLFGFWGQDYDDGWDDFDYDEIDQELAYYPLDDGNYAVGVGAYRHWKSVTVPEKYMGGRVTEIVENGFADMPNLVNIKLPKTITSIPSGAFENCKKLEKIAIGNVVVEKNLVYTINGKVYGMPSQLEIADNALDGTAFMHMTFKDSHDKQSMVELSVENPILEVTKISVTPKLNGTTDMYTTTDIAVSSKDINTTVNFGTYGLFKNVDVVLFNGDVEISRATIGDIKVTASHYNFAYLNATYPVLVASLKLNEITDNGTIPTFVALERNAAYNWDDLPYNMSCLPMLTREQATNGGFHERRVATEEYIKELYELDPSSHFSLYVVDNYPELIIEFLIANGIPEDNWNAVMLSDGSGTAYYLSDTFGVDDPSAKYDTMKQEWNALKEYFYNKGSFDFETDCKYIYNNTSAKGFTDMYAILVRYPYVIAKEQNNVSWWVNRLRAGENLSAINEKDAAFTADIIATTQQFYTNNLLAALSADETEAFKTLYNFNGEMFSVAEEQGKKVMVILGTSWGIEEPGFYNYMKTTMKYYGDDYVYYYKGHPGYPTSLYAGRAAALEQLRAEGYTIYELDNAIAAEVILFFYPSIHSSGWSSSTFDSLEDDSKAGILFNMAENGKEDLTYGEMMEAYVTNITKGTVSYGNIVLSAEKQYCLVEYTNTDKYASKVENYAKHEIAIYNVTDDEIKYYKSVGTNMWQEVKADGTAVA